jgi:deazaflavin-dependent oxidoreductase (nitroreductase family)
MSFAAKPPSTLQRMLQRLPASPLGAWVFARTLHPLDRMLLRLSRGRVSIPGVLTGLPVVMLTTTGAKSGKPRTVPLVGMSDGDKVVVIASNYGQTHHPGWYYNLRAHPQATLELPGRSGRYVAREATPAEWQIYWRRAADLYIGFPAYQQRTHGRPIPIIVLTPQAE